MFPFFQWILINRHKYTQLNKPVLFRLADLSVYTREGRSKYEHWPKALMQASTSSSTLADWSDETLSILFYFTVLHSPSFSPHLIFHSSLWSLSFSVWKWDNATRGKGNRINKAENGSDVRGVTGFSFSSKADKSWSHMDNTTDKTHPEKNKVHKRKKNQRSIITVLRQQQKKKKSLRNSFKGTYPLNLASVVQQWSLMVFENRSANEHRVSV